MLPCGSSILETDLDVRMRSVVGETGLEPATPYTPCRCATKLRHSPTRNNGSTGLLIQARGEGDGFFRGSAAAGAALPSTSTSPIRRESSGAAIGSCSRGALTGGVHGRSHGRRSRARSNQALGSRGCRPIPAYLYTEVEGMAWRWTGLSRGRDSDRRILPARRGRRWGMALSSGRQSALRPCGDRWRGR